MKASFRYLIGMASIGVLAVIQTADAQEPSGRAVSVIAGALQYDLSGTGTTPLLGARFDLPVTRFLIVEPGVTYARYTPQLANSRELLLFPELHVHVQARAGRLRPFVGGGVGRAVVGFGGEIDSYGSVSAAAGMRLDLARTWGGRAELRLRGFDKFTSSTADWTVGVMRQL